MSEAVIAEVQALLEGSSYRLIRLLGQGAMGAVYLAEQTRIKRPVVVKIMHPHVGEAQIDRLRLEAQALAKLSHENIVEVLDYGTTADHRPYLVMEYLEGRSLDKLLEERGFVTVEEALALTQEILAGLAAVHQEELVHRDLKPGNLFLCNSGRLKLLDFGLIKLLKGATGIDPLQNPTSAGATVGTPRYLAPEQASGGEIDQRTDLYAVGMILCHLLTGRTPFDHHGELAAMLLAHVKDEPPPPSELASQPLPAGLDAVVLKALAKKPQDRYASALEMSAALYSLGQAYDALAAELGLEQVNLGSGEHHQIELEVGTATNAPTRPMAAHRPEAGAPRPTVASPVAPPLDANATMALSDWDKEQIAASDRAQAPRQVPPTVTDPHLLGGAAATPAYGSGPPGAAYGSGPPGAAYGSGPAAGPPWAPGVSGSPAALGSPAGLLTRAWSDPVARRMFWLCAAGSAILTVLVGLLL